MVSGSHLSCSRHIADMSSNHTVPLKTSRRLRTAVLATMKLKSHTNTGSEAEAGGTEHASRTCRMELTKMNRHQFTQVCGVRVAAVLTP